MSTPEDPIMRAYQTKSIESPRTNRNFHKLARKICELVLSEMNVLGFACCSEAPEEAGCGVLGEEGLEPSTISERILIRTVFLREVWYTENHLV